MCMSQLTAKPNVYVQGITTPVSYADFRRKVRPRDNLTRLLAHQLWLNRGSPAGGSEQDWLAAERQLFPWDTNVRSQAAPADEEKTSEIASVSPISRRVRLRDVLIRQRAHQRWLDRGVSAEDQSNQDWAFAEKQLFPWSIDVPKDT